MKFIAVIKDGYTREQVETAIVSVSGVKLNNWISDFLVAIESLDGQDHILALKATGIFQDVELEQENYALNK